MSQIALLSHVSYLKFKDEEERNRQETRDGKKHFINKTNAEAYMLIAGGALK